MFLKNAAVCALSVAMSASAVFAQKVDRSRPMVVVISLDAFGAESLRDPNVPAPTLRKLMSQGAYARSMEPVNPTVTWPNHTAMITGVNVSKHFVFANGLIENQRVEGKEPHVRPYPPRKDLVHAPTLYDLVHNSGMTTAQVDWVAIHLDPSEPQTVDYKFAEDPDPDGPVEKEMIAAGEATRDQLAHFHGAGTSQPWRDRLYTQAAARIIREHHPNLMLLHLLALDSMEHHYGYNTDAGFATIAFLDDRVKDIVDAVREAGDIDRTTFVIVSDHGQQSVHHLVHPNAMLRAAGISASEATAIPEGGLTLVYEKHATPELTARIKQAFEEKEGFLRIVTPEHYAEEEFPKPSETSQSPDVIGYATDDYAMAGGDSGPAVTPTAQQGQHGYPRTNPLMHEIFISAGKGIRAVGEIPTFPNVDVAPTLAHLLGVKMTDIQGVELNKILR